MNIASYPTRHDNTSLNETNDIYLKQYSTQHGRKCLFITMAFSLGEHNCVGNTLKRKFSANYVNISFKCVHYENNRTTISGADYLGWQRLINYTTNRTHSSTSSEI